MDLDLVASEVGNKRTFHFQSTGSKKYSLNSIITVEKIPVTKKYKSTLCVEPVLILTK